ncbi:MAG: GT-D fold domain-containing glycosyltransferase [Sedimentisphaerales bacterium]|nr:GT-D fold domain-containing glycosyltransferase [Sedimentisphaerales bacterium]
MLKKVKKELNRLDKRLFHSSKKDKQLEELQYKLDNIPYEIYDKIVNNSFSVQLPKIKSIEDTLDKIINEKCSISRFGDGEFACMNYSRIAYHDPSEDLAERLKEVLSSDLPNLLIGLHDCFGSLDCYVPYTRKFWRKCMSKKREMTYSYLNMERVYYNAFFNRYYLNFNKTDEYYQICCTYFKRLKEIWKNRDVILLEGQEERLGVGNDILDGAKSISRIIFCPVKNAFNKYDQILSAFDEVNSDALILAALGPTATVLAFDLCKKGYQAVDIGSISDEYECFLRKETPLELRSMGHNVTMKHLSNPDDPEYKKQIIKTLV